MSFHKCDGFVAVDGVSIDAVGIDFGRVGFWGLSEMYLVDSVEF